MRFHVEEVGAYWTVLMPVEENGIPWSPRDFPTPCLPEGVQEGDVIEFSAVIVERGPEPEEE